MKGRSVRWWWDEKVENFPLGVALDKWASKTYAMCILQGLREISAEKLEWDFRKEESLCKAATLSSQSSRIDIILGGRNTSGGWIMFTKTPEQGRTRGKERDASTAQADGGRGSQTRSISKHLMCRYLRGISPIIRPLSPWKHITWLHAAVLRTPGAGQRKDVWLVCGCETIARSSEVDAINFGQIKWFEVVVIWDY